MSSYDFQTQEVLAILPAPGFNAEQDPGGPAPPTGLPFFFSMIQLVNP